jgi:deazaflavin-dependent oxidoreductase (nitroreductase family)
VTAAPAHPTQLLLPGQAAAPEGPIDLTAMYVMHRAFRRDLDAFVAVFPAVDPGDRARWRVLRRRFDLFATFLHKHHAGEDAHMWPLLRGRGADPDVLDRLEAEHAGIDPLLGSCAAALGALAGGRGGEATRRELVDTAARMRDALGAHLAHEERDGMALVQRHLTPEDWARLDEVFARDYRPRDALAALGWVTSALPPEATARLLGPRPVLAALARLLGRRAAGADARLLGVRPPTAGLSRGDRVATVVSRRVAALHTRLLRRTGGRVGSRFRGGDVVLVTCRGRVSGKERSTPLIHVRDGEDVVVAASNGGIDTEPQWWLNLRAHPHGTVEVRGRRWPVVAGEVEEPERARLWAALSARFDGYDGYQAKVSRRIAVVRLSPAGD